MTQAASPDWWQALYDDAVAEAFLVRRDPDELAATAAFLRDRLHLTPGQTLFDQCCGIGSLSLPLAREGIHVIGVDQAEAYIRRARADAEREGLPCEYHADDAFSFTPGRPADAAVNWGTSFGNADDARNALMLRRVFETVRPGGRFALDYQHVPRVLRTFQHAMVRRVTGERGETVILRESAVDLPQGTLRQRWTLHLPGGGRLERSSAVRLYLPHELAALVRAAGFVEVTFAGGVRNEPLTLDSPRCILLARRPE
jgi:SAM-dependent methyltransferase